MSVLSDRFAPELPSTMQLPFEIVKLWEWMESRGWGDAPYPPESNATYCWFDEFAGDDVLLDLGVSDDHEEQIQKRLFLFATIGGDGAKAGWWLTDDGRMIVIRTDGFDGESAMFDSTADFLRALAMGYRELANPFREDDEPEETFRNHELAGWLRSELGLEVPESVAELASAHGAEFDAWLQALRND